MRDVTPTSYSASQPNMASVKLWSEDDCNKLIDAVRQQPVLWKIDDSGYGKRQNGGHDLQRISNSLNATLLGVFYGWTSGRYNFRDNRAWRGRGTHRLTALYNQLQSVNAA